MSRTEKIITVIYLTAIAFLCSRTTAPIKVDYGVCNDFFKSNNRDLLNVMEGYKNIIFVKGVKGDHGQVYEQGASKLDSETKMFINYLERCKQEIEGDNSKNINNVYAFTEADNKYINRLFIKKGIADSIENKVKTLLQQYYIAESFDSITFKNLIPGNVWDSFKSPAQPSTEGWGARLFHHQSLQGAITMLSFIENNIWNSEQIVMKRVYELLYREHSGGCGYDTILGLAKPRNNIISLGEKASADILFAALTPSFPDSFYSATGTLRIMQRHYAEWSTIADKPGLMTVKGTVSELNHEGYYTKTIPWSFQYLVGEKSVSLQIDNANFLYADVPNPVSISAPGYNADRLELRIPGAVLKQMGGGKYLVTPAITKGKLVAYIDIKSGNATSHTLLAKPVFIKRFTHLYTYIGERNNDTIPLQYIRTFQGINVRDGDDWDLSSDIKGFELSIVKNGKTVTGPFEIDGSTYNSNFAAMDAINQLTEGDKLIISDVKVETSPGNLVSVVPLITNVK